MNKIGNHSDIVIGCDDNVHYTSRGITNVNILDESLFECLLSANLSICKKLTLLGTSDMIWIFDSKKLHTWDDQLWRDTYSPLDLLCF